MLGLVGGFSGIIWASLSFVLGGYELFKLENSLIRAVYRTSPESARANFSNSKSEINDEIKAKRAMMQTVAHQGKCYYSYPDYCISIIMRALCCCCRHKGCIGRRMKKLERYEIASSRLAHEVDIV